MTDETKFTAGSFFLFFSVLCIIACVGFLYKIHKGIVISPRCIEVSAEVEKIIPADNAVWKLNFFRSGTSQESLNNLVLEDRKIVQKFFEENGIKKEDMEFSSFIREDYRETKKNEVPCYQAGNNLVIKSNDIKKTLFLRDNLSKLYKEGVVLKNNDIDFLCSNNDQIKDQLASEASVKAYLKASKLAKDLHVKIRRINRVYDPNFQIEGFNRNYLVRSFGAFNSIDNESQDSSQPIPRRKMKAIVRMDVEIK